MFAPRQDIRLPSVAAHRKTNNDLRKALAHVTSDSVKSAAKGQHINTVMFEEDEKDDSGLLILLESIMIEKSVPRITVWHHEACRVMTNGDHEGRIFLSHPHTNNIFYLLTIKYRILIFFLIKKKTSRSS